MLRSQRLALDRLLDLHEGHRRIKLNNFYLLGGHLAQRAGGRPPIATTLTSRIRRACGCTSSGRWTPGISTSDRRRRVALTPVHVARADESRLGVRRCARARRSACGDSLARSVEPRRIPAPGSTRAWRRPGGLAQNRSAVHRTVGSDWAAVTERSYGTACPFAPGWTTFACYEATDFGNLKCSPAWTKLARRASEVWR